MAEHKLQRDSKGRFVKGIVPWDKGIKIDRKTHPNMGHHVKHSLDTISKMKKAHAGVPLSEKHRDGIRKALTGRVMTKEWIEKIRIANTIDGRTPKNKLIRGSVAFSNWRKDVFGRDSYTCQDCHKKGGYLHAHHIKQFAFYPELRLDVNNGITLCVKCHRKIKHIHVTKFLECS